MQTLGFTTTSYLEEVETIPIADRLEVRLNAVSNVVFHNPLVEGLETSEENQKKL